jgi:hypothetical protein
MHHALSTGAVLLNWRTHINGVPTGFTPSNGNVQRYAERAFGDAP